MLKKYAVIILFIYCTGALADQDPFTKSSNHLMGIMFGPLGTRICVLSLASAFILAAQGKVTWDRFVFIALCIAGFMGSPLIVSMIKGWVI
jgi:type IV secretory pathway VirB2 component (pilin)